MALGVSGRQNLTFIGRRSYSGRPGEVRAVGRSGSTVVRADLTGNRDLISKYCLDLALSVRVILQCKFSLKLDL